jgi:hypothetical protein
MLPRPEAACYPCGMQSDPTTGFVLILLLIGAVLLPGFIASLRGHRHRMAIWALTILLGWTGLGWIIAFVWSLMGQRDAIEAAFPAASRQAQPLRAYAVPIAGLQHPPDGDTVPRADYARRKVRVGDAVRLKEEPGNPHDSNAVAVLHGLRRYHLGYIPAEVPFVKSCLREGDTLKATVSEIGPYVGDDGRRRFGVTLTIAILADGRG